MSRTDVGANLDSSFRKSATIIRELARTWLIPDQRFNRQLVPSGPARRNSGNARIKTSGVARHTDNEPLRTRIMQETHDSVLTGHPRRNTLYALIPRTFTGLTCQRILEGSSTTVNVVERTTYGGTAGMDY